MDQLLMYVEALKGTAFWKASQDAGSMEFHLGLSPEEVWAGRGDSV